MGMPPAYYEAFPVPPERLSTRDLNIIAGSPIMEEQGKTFVREEDRKISQKEQIEEDEKRKKFPWRYKDYE